MLDTIYYLLPYLSANIHERVIDKYCKRELLQDPEKEESVNYCDRNYKILADYQYCSVFIVGYDFCVVGWLGCFGLNGPLRQYFSLYRAVSQREGERKEK